MSTTAMAQTLTTSASTAPQTRRNASRVSRPGAVRWPRQGVAPGSGPSMLPTFLVWNEWFVADRSYRRGRGVRVGDCVTYTIPVEPHEGGVKRVIGMPGDYVLLNSPGSKNDDMMQVSEKGLGRPLDATPPSFMRLGQYATLVVIHKIC